MIQQTCVKQYNIMSIMMFHVLLFAGDTHKINKQHVHFVPQ